MLAKGANGNVATMIGRRKENDNTQHEGKKPRKTGERERKKI